MFPKRSCCDVALNFGERNITTNITTRLHELGSELHSGDAVMFLLPGKRELSLDSDGGGHAGTVVALSTGSGSPSQGVADSSSTHPCHGTQEQ